MIKSHHLYPFFPDLIENQRRSVQCFWEKGLLEEFELFSYILGKKKNLQMILHSSQFMLQRPKYNLSEAIRNQKSYSVSLYIPIELKWYENIKNLQGWGVGSAQSQGGTSKTWGSGGPGQRPRPDQSSTQTQFSIPVSGDIEVSGAFGPAEPHLKALQDFVPGAPPNLLVKEIFPVFLGDIPLMTERGSFLINGSARVLVNQIVRCPSVYFKVKIDHKNRRTYIASFLSDYGSWLRLETDYKSRIWVRIDKSQRVSIYALLRSLGFPESFLKYQLKYYSFLFASRETYYTEKPNEAIQYLWKKLTPGRWNSLQGCYSFLYNKFFNPRRYSIGPVGRLRLNKRLNRKIEKGSPILPTLTPEDIFMALDLLIQLHYGEGSLDDIDHLKNRRVRLPGELIQNQLRLALSRMTQIAADKISKFEIEKDLPDRPVNTKNGKEDIYRAEGHQNAGFNKTSQALKPQTSVPVKNFFQAQIFGSSIRELFHTSQLSQYMDQTNPLAEITHKRRLSSLGPGGIGRDQAGFAVREIHPSHFGRICPIETPEGPNAGLVGSLASYSRITEDGFLQSPYFAAGRRSEYTKMLPTVASQLFSGSEAVGQQDFFFFSADIEDEFFICSEKESLSRDTIVGEVQSEIGDSTDVFTDSVALLSRAKLPESQKPTLSSTGAVIKNRRKSFYPTRYKQEFFTVEKNQIQFFSVSPIQMISLATSLIPFLEHDDANRALMGSNMQRQAVPILFPEKPLVGTGLELQAARDSSTPLLSKSTGQVIHVDSEKILVSSPKQLKQSAKAFVLNNSFSQFSGTESFFEKTLNESDIEMYTLQNYWRSNQNTCLRQRPQVKQGEWVEKGDLLADGSATHHGEIALGKNILLAYMPWEGYNFEDAIVINERLVQEDIYTSIHIDRYDIEIRDTVYGKEKITHDLPYINSEQLRNLDYQGIIYPGTWVEEGDILVGKITPISPPKPTPEYRLLLAIFETKPLPFKETSLRVPQGVEGRVLDCIIEYQVKEGTSSRKSASFSQQSLNNRSGDFGSMTEHNLVSDMGGREGRRGLSGRSPAEPQAHSLQKVQIFLAHKRKIQLGDKMSGRHGNKGIVSLILPPQDMPFLQDGTPVDIVLNPLGVPSRMNVGQVLECLFGLAAHHLKEHYRLLPFDEVYGKDASRGLVYQKLFEASQKTGYSWLFDPNSPGKSHLFDGRTGDPFHQPILVGYSYMFKLIHLVDEKMHARSTGPYSLVTQQPLGGRSKHGGQRLGEMEVWALEGFGAASILQEFLTVKSDEIYARNTFLFHLMKRRKLPRAGLPESFRVLVHELQALCLSVYYNPDFRLTYPSLIGWDGLFLLSSKKFPTLQQLSHLKNI